MSNHRSTHHHSTLNSIPQIRLPLPTSIAPMGRIAIKRENGNNDDVVLLQTVPKVPHTSDDYNPECQCSTCQLANKLMAECTCGECRGHQCNEANQKEGQSVESCKNVTIRSEVNVPPNVQPSESSIQNNAASTSGHMKGIYQDDDSSRGSTTTDSLGRFIDDDESESDSSSESTESSTSDDSEDDDENSDKKISQESESDSSDPDYVCPSPNIPSKSFKRSHHSISTKHCKPTVTEKRLKCPRCNQRFATSTNLNRHYREKHHQQKPFYCKWSQCDVVLARRDNLFYHIAEKHLNNRTEKAQIGQRKTSAQKDPATRGLLKSCRVKRSDERIGQMACPKCKRKLPSESHLDIHLHTHKRPGFRCAWLNCGFFYSRLSRAKDHVYADHLQVELANSQLLNRHLVKVNPRTNKLDKVRHKRSLNSTGHSRSRQLSTSSSESSSSKSSSSDSGKSSNSNSNNDQTDQIKSHM